MLFVLRKQTKYNNREDHLTWRHETFECVSFYWKKNKGHSVNYQNSSLIYENIDLNCGNEFLLLWWNLTPWQTTHRGHGKFILIREKWFILSCHLSWLNVSIWKAIGNRISNVSKHIKYFQIMLLAIRKKNQHVKTCILVTMQCINI